MGMWITKRRRGELSMHEMFRVSGPLVHRPAISLVITSTLPAIFSSRINVYPSSIRFTPSFRPSNVFIPTHLFLYSKCVYAHPDPLCFITYFIAIVYPSCLPSTRRPHSPLLARFRSPAIPFT